MKNIRVVEFSEEKSEDENGENRNRVKLSEM
jgi:hypothetical protein